MRTEDKNRIEQLEDFINQMKKIEQEKGVKMENFIVISNLGTMSYCDTPNMMTLLTIYMRERLNQGALDEDMIDHICEIAKMSDDEIESQSKEMMKKILEDLKNELTGGEE